MDESSRLKTIQSRYVDSFTMHGLHHIINGTIVEKVLWTIKLTAAIIFACYLSKDLLMTYFNYGTNTVISMESKSELQLPKVSIHSARLLLTGETNVFADCSSKWSKSYDKNECDALASTNICKLLDYSSKKHYPKDSYEVDSEQGDVTCHSYMEINKNGNFYQTGTVSAMRHTMHTNLSQNPLFLWISSPGDGPNLPSTFNTFRIDLYGDYHFSLAKTTINRLPAPYSKPPCVMQNSSSAYEGNLFRGDYSLENCWYTSYLKAIMQTCRTIHYFYRDWLRDKGILKQILDRNVSAMNQCVNEKESDWNKVHAKCSSFCRSACTETTYNLKQKYIPNTQAPTRIRLFFYYPNLKETIINHVPSFTPSTLFANLGGSLGLMAGVSAISIVELFVWFILIVVDRLERIRHH